MSNSITSLLFFCLLLHSWSVQSRDQIVTTKDVNAPTKPLLNCREKATPPVNGTEMMNITLPTVAYDLDWDLKIDGERTSEKMAPGLYVFGDSFVDPGNNNLLPTTAKTNFLPYGIDFLGVPTGRITNGKTMADILGRKLGLPYPPPYLGLMVSQRKNVTTGVNYASASCGILPDTGTTVGQCVNLDHQIDFFQSTITDDLPTHFNSCEALSDHLSKSIFFISIGINDYLLNYLHPNMTSTRKYSNVAFASLLSDEFSKRIERLYQLGGRKFLINDLGKPGCSPQSRNWMKEKGRPCVEFLNKLVALYDANVAPMIQNLQSKLPGSIFVRMNTFNIFRELTELNPSKYGITETKTQCCGNGIDPCPRNSEVVGNRDQHIYFDGSHRTQAANDAVIRLCFNESSFCSPMNIQQLVKA